MKELQLGGFLQGHVKVFSGRENGEKARAALCLDECDKSDEKFTVMVPRKIWSINASFFLGCFGNSVRKLGEFKFREKYRFDCDEVLNNNIDDGIYRALNTEEPI